MGAYYSAVRSLANLVLGVVTGRELKGRENIPRTGALIVASNHVSFWDPPLVGAAVPRDAYYLAKEELFKTPILGWMIRSVHSIPIRRGAADLSGLSRAIAMLKRGKALVIFPEGSRMKDGELHPSRPGLGMLAVQADATILPCFISGSNQPRRWIVRRTRVRVWFGVARHWREFAGPDSDIEPGRVLYQRVGESVMREIAVLKSGQQASASRGAA